MIDKSDRSTFNNYLNILDNLLEYLEDVYIIGESFGCLISLSLKKYNNIKGITLINPATSYNCSPLKLYFEELVKEKFFGYNIKLMGLFKLLKDEYSFRQLLLIVNDEGLPKVIGKRKDEAYLGRFALGLGGRIFYMDRGMVKFR